MSLDLKRYEGHTPVPWTLCGHVGHYDPADPLVLHKLSEADTNLLTDAPLLLARVAELEVETQTLKARVRTCPYCEGHRVIEDIEADGDCPVCEGRGTVTFQDIYTQNERLVKDIRSMAQAYASRTGDLEARLAGLRAKVEGLA